MDSVEGRPNCHHEPALHQPYQVWVEKFPSRRRRKGSTLPGRYSWNRSSLLEADPGLIGFCRQEFHRAALFVALLRTTCMERPDGVVSMINPTIALSYHIFGSARNAKF